MAGLIKTNAVQLGDSTTAAHNFTLQTNVDGTAKLARGNVGATTQDILTVDAAGIVDADIRFLQPGTGAVSRTLEDKARESVSVFDFMTEAQIADTQLTLPVLDHTSSILSALAASQGKVLMFPSGNFNFTGLGNLSTAGTKIQGAGRKSTIIRCTVPAPSNLFYLTGYGASIESVGFTAAVPQTGGNWVVLGGIENVFEDFFMDGDFGGIYMSGNAARVLHGRMQDAASGATRVFCTGGDNTQTIDDLLIGAQISSPNIAAAGIKVKNSTALTITNTSVIQMGINLLIETQSPVENVNNLKVSNSYFDSGLSAITLICLGGGSISRVSLSDVWASGASGDGIFLSQAGAGVLQGVSLINVEASINGGSGISANGSIGDLKIIGGSYSQNAYGMYLGATIDRLIITGASIGTGSNFGGNTVQGLNIGSNVTNATITGNIIRDNTVQVVNTAGSTCRISNNSGYDIESPIPSLAADTGAGLIGHIDSAVGAVATTVQARLSKMPDTAGGFWPDSAPVGVIQRLYDRVFIGGATAADGTLANVVKDWLETERAFTTRNSQFTSTSTIGQVAVLGGSRSSDFGIAGSMGCIGVSGFVINDNAAQVQSAYAGYFEARRKAGTGITHGMEIDIVNQGDSVVTNPFGSFAPDGMTNGLWIASGGEIAAAPASVAIGIVNNGAAFNSGIVFQANSITGTDGVNGVGAAISFAKGHVLQWFNSAGSQTSYIYSAAASNNLGAGVLLDDGRASFVNSGAGGSTKFVVEYGVNDVNYIGTVGAVAGLPANLQAMGADTDIDIRLAPKGAGVLAVTYGSDAATAPASFSATRRLAFKDGNNITWYIPISTVAW